jgi:hypothetical protein
VSTSRDPLPPAAPGRVAPLPLTVALALTLLEGAGLVVYGLALIPAMSGEKIAMGATTPLFFLCYGTFLGFCAWQLHRLRTWARAPVVLAQLIQMLVGASFRGGSTTVVAVVAVVVAVIVLAGIFHPASMGALDGAD